LICSASRSSHKPFGPHSIGCRRLIRCQIAYGSYLVAAYLPVLRLPLSKTVQIPARSVRLLLKLARSGVFGGLGEAVQATLGKLTNSDSNYNQLLADAAALWQDIESV